MWWSSLGLLSLSIIGWAALAARRLLYPAPRTLSTPDVDAPWRHEQLPAAGGEPIPIWRLPAQHPKGLVLLCHGYYANRYQVLGIAVRLQQRGYESVIMELRGHGMRPGPCTLGAREAEDAQRILAWMQQQHGSSAPPIGVVGLSMGAAVICEAARQAPVKAVVADSVYARLFPVLCLGLWQEYFLPPVPFGWGAWWAAQAALRRRLSAIDPIRAAATMRQPLLAIHGGKDRRVPPALGQGVYDRWGGPKQRWFDPDVAHVGMFARDPDRYAERVAAFFDRALG